MTRRFCAALTLALLIIAGCRGKAQETQNDDSVSITKWTEKTELFVEFAPLLVGKETSFAVHLTDLDTFKRSPLGH